MTELPITLVPERPSDCDAIEKLHRRTFGPGRFTRTAFRIREQAPHDPRLSFTAHVGTMMVGSVRLTHIAIGETPALLLGPLTVEPPFRAVGIGCAADGSLHGSGARRRSQAHHSRGRCALYYNRFGFRHVPPGRIQMPGPCDPARLLVAELVPGAFEGVHGPARGARTPPAIGWFCARKRPRQRLPGPLCFRRLRADHSAATTSGLPRAMRSRLQQLGHEESDLDGLVRIEARVRNRSGSGPAGPRPKWRGRRPCIRLHSCRSSQMDAAGIGSLGPVHIEEGLDFRLDALERARLVAGTGLMVLPCMDRTTHTTLRPSFSTARMRAGR